MISGGRTKRSRRLSRHSTIAISTSLPDFKDTNTTTEFLTKHIYDRLAEAARAGKLGRAGRELKAIRVTLSESHVARAWYEAALW